MINLLLFFLLLSQNINVLAKLIINEIDEDGDLNSVTNNYGNAVTEMGDVFTNEWAVHLPLPTSKVTKIARQLGFDNLGQIGDLKGYYLLRRMDHPPKSKRNAFDHTNKLLNDKRILWAEQQKHLIRQKREFVDLDENLDRARSRLLRYKTRKNQLSDFIKNVQLMIEDKELSAEDSFEKEPAESFRRRQDLHRRIVEKRLDFNDEFWPKQWYMHDLREDTHLDKTDLHIIPVWLKNLTGNGVVVTIIDDGIEHNNTDLAKNYDSEASYDLNDDDPDPMPRYDPTNDNAHGTRCAGEVAMVANNGFCGVGVAYNAKIGGIRLLDGKITDTTEGRALSHRVDHVDIYSSSWGPLDDGKSIGGPGKMAANAIEMGIQQGRDGKGVIYIWAGGNGGGEKAGDNCNYDGYVQSVYTIAINSISQSDEISWYAEACPAIIASAYSSNHKKEPMIISSDLNNKCTEKHSGTSAAAPLIAGVVALALEANKNLTWRDVQHLLVWTCEVGPVQGNADWARNAAGYWVNRWIGFGIVNAASLIDLALEFESVPPKYICDNNRLTSSLPLQLASGEEKRIIIHSNGCAGSANEVNFLEHVQMIVTMNYSRRGSLQMFLVSPLGTISKILSTRDLDNSSEGFDEWPLMTLQCWGEPPRGTWTFIVKDLTNGTESGAVLGLKLLLHGTKTAAAHVLKAGGRRPYNYQYNNQYNSRRLSQME